MIITNITYAYV